MAKKDMKNNDIEEIKRKRREAGEAAKSAKQADLNHREEFRKYFAKISGKLKLEKSMENVIWLHFQSCGFTEKEKFDEGIKHFGYKIQ